MNIQYENKKFVHETQINPMHFFRILFQVNICNEFKRKKDNKWQTTV